MRHVWAAGVITFALALVIIRISSSNGEALFPSMVGEIVTLRLVSGGRINVHVSYEVEGDLRSGRALVFPETEWFPLENFKARWNGISLPAVCIQAPADAYYSYRDRRFTAVHRFAIPPTESTGGRKTHRLENEYVYVPPYYGPGSKTDDPEGRYVEYILVTGSTWRGSIGYVKVIFHPGCIPCEKITVLPGSYGGVCTEKNKWEFNAKNIVPDRDIRLLLPFPEYGSCK